MTLSIPKAVWTNDAGSMAQDTARTRWPQTVQKMVDDVAESLKSCSDIAKLAEGKSIMAQLCALKDAISNDAAIKPLPGTSADVKKYNQELESLGPLTWHAAPWLYSECYLYRHVQCLLERSDYWTEYDIFKRQKDATFAHSRAAVEELAKRYETMVGERIPTGGPAAQLLFEEMTQIALWGNATDLSLLVKLSLDEIQSLQGSAAIRQNQRNIVVNDMQKTWRYLQARTRIGQIDIVLDNSGFEFFTDLVYASYLLRSGLASKIVLHVKDFPWFVSDVTPNDLDSVLSMLASSTVFPDRSGIDPLLLSLKGDFAQGTIDIARHSFWTQSASFHHLPSAASDLMAMLRKSDLVIFKGDLNYRKLVNDSFWPHTTPFDVALGPMGRSSGVKILSLRTNKADVCVGLASEDLVQSLDREAPDAAWIRSGRYAVISFNAGL